MSFSGHFYQITQAAGLDLNKELNLLRKANKSGDKLYDPELLYVECQLCGKPVLWESGRTTQLLAMAGIEPEALDNSCMILSDGCPLCQPEDIDAFSLSVVRIAALNSNEILHLLKPSGNA